jgi:hypothetical protein
MIGTTSGICLLTFRPGSREFFPNLARKGTVTDRSDTSEAHEQAEVYRYVWPVNVLHSNVEWTRLSNHVHVIQKKIWNPSKGDMVFVGSQNRPAVDDVFWLRFQ